MTRIKEIRNWLFKSIIIDNKIDDLEYSGLNVRSPTDSKSIERLIALENFSPNVRSKVMGTLRAEFFKDTVKMKMSGFIGTVSAVHNVIKILFVTRKSFTSLYISFLDSGSS